MRKKILSLLVVVLAFTSPAMAQGPWVIDGSNGIGLPLNNLFQTMGCAIQYGSTVNLIITYGPNQSSAIWTKIPLQTKEFTFIVGLEVFPRPHSDRSADGFTLVLSNRPGLGETGENLGFAGQRPDYPPLERSFASIFKYFAVRPNQERVEHSYGGYFQNGERIPAIPEQQPTRFVDLSARGIELPSGHFLVVSLQYRGGVLTTVVDDLTSGKWVSYSTRVDLPRLLGDYAYFGMTGATGVETSTVKVQGVVWTDNGDPALLGMKSAAPVIWIEGPWPR